MGDRQPDPAILESLSRAGFATDPGELELRALDGGVSSDIWLVKAGNRQVCVKRALPKLRVAAEWMAPIERNLYEARWMQWADTAVPGCAPRLLHQDEAAGLLVMEYLPPSKYPLWKSELKAGHAEPDFAREVGRTLALIHGATAGRPDVAEAFPTDAIFHDIRLEPYLLATAQACPQHAHALKALADRTAATRTALVHGDVSPKNILCGARGPVFLDAECAWYGDPAFDIAFCLNHLLLKCLWVPDAAGRFLACFDRMARGYLAAVSWEIPARLEERAATLLPGLFLARVDGKSPVEDLTEETEKRRVRRVAGALLRDPVARLSEVREIWAGEVL